MNWGAGREGAREGLEGEKEGRWQRILGRKKERKKKKIKGKGKGKRK